ncbi:Methionine--tRNA ligase 1 [Frankliniella fusca]|uniref:Methionine--tRNA ligase 1 n=1 Tax=Frankliniella fusca TaxID=407009 RepID=A0AAE1GUE2_9NEOP|nr:Methionine--tRNA ligase 1 [Frankliniella fusca]
MLKYSRILKRAGKKAPRQTVHARKQRNALKPVVELAAEEHSDPELITDSTVVSPIDRLLEPVEPPVAEASSEHQPNQDLRSDAATDAHVHRCLESVEETDENWTEDDEEVVRAKRHKFSKRGRKLLHNEESHDSLPSSDEEICSDASAETVTINAEPASSAAREVLSEHDTVILEAEFSDDCDNSFKERSKSTEPLCPCTETTVDDLLYMTLTLGLRHGLTWAAQLDILKMMRCVFGDKKIPLSKNSYFKKLSAVSESDIDYHVFCDDCNSYLGKRDFSEYHCLECKKVFPMDEDTDCVVCNVCSIPLVVKKVKADERQCDVCEKKIALNLSNNLFVSVSIESQLRKFLEEESFVNNLVGYRFSRDTIPGTFSDIYDGEVYQNLFENNGILSSPYNFSYTFFTDGVANGKSTSVKTIWPIYLTINEIPYEERSKYMIVAGIYAGPREPNQSWFLQPFVEQANKLSSKGFSWSHQDESVVSLVLPLCFVADSVARFQMLNRLSFHAKDGCTFCYQQSVYVRKAMSQCYVPYLTESPACIRSQDSHRHDVAEAEKLHSLPDVNVSNYRGVKGSCQLDNFKLL